MRIRAVNIHEQTFSVSFRGFDPKEVDEFLDKVAQEIEYLNSEKETLEAALAKEKDDRLKLEEALAASRDLQKTIMDHARREAHLVEERARLEAEKMINEARRVLDSYIRDIEMLREKRITFLSEMAGMAESLREWMERQPDEPGPSVESIEAAAREAGRTSFPEPKADPYEDEEEETPEAIEEAPRPAFDLSPPKIVETVPERAVEPAYDDEPAPISVAEPSPKQSSTLFSLVDK